MMAALYDAEVANGHFISTGAPTTDFFHQAVRHGRVRIASSAGNFETPVSIEVALRGTALIGFTTTKAWIDPEQLAANAGRGQRQGGAQEAELWMLIVTPAERRRGIGAILLDRQIASAVGLVGSLDKLVARCAPASIGAKRLLLKRGFLVKLSRPDGELLRCSPA